MRMEIERKFLVKDISFLSEASKIIRITQGYLSTLPQRTVRVRVCSDNAYITIKGINRGNSRFEWEKEIDVNEAKDLIGLCENVIDKTRYIVPFEGHDFEVDVFYGENEGLVVAEIELESEDEEFSKPSWLGEEVSSDPRYYNSSLILNPFTTW